MAQPASQFQPRELVRSVPFSTSRGEASLIAAGGGTGFGFDVGLALTDRNQIGYSTPVLGFPTIATGFFLDVSLFSDQACTLDVLFRATFGGTDRSVIPGGAPLVVAANTLTLVAGLRVVGLFVTVNYVNTSGVLALCELFATIRSA